MFTEYRFFRGQQVWGMLFAVALVGFTPPTVRADEALPRRELDAAALGAPLDVVLLQAGEPMRLEIPKELLPKNEAGQGAEKEAGLIGGIDGLRTVISGVAMSLAIAIGGLWFVRRLRTPGVPLPRGTAAVVAVGLLTSLAIATAWADIPPPSGTRGGKPRPRPEPVNSLTLKVVVVDEGERIVLHASAADLARMTAQAKKPLLKEAPKKSPKEDLREAPKS